MEEDTMSKAILRTFIALVVTLSLTFGVIFGVGTSLASAATSQPSSAEGYNPVGSVPTGMGYCYPSGYNRQGWRCGWRLAMAPYNLGDANRYGYYGYNNYGYGYYGYNYGYGYGYPYNSGIQDYGGRPRFGPYYYPYNNYYPNNYYGWPPY